MADYVISTQISLTDKFTDRIKKISKETKSFNDRLKELNKNLDSNKFLGKKDYFKWLGTGVSQSTKLGMKALDKYENRIISFSRKVNSLGKSVFKGVLGLGVAGVGAGIGGLKVGADFEQYKAMMMTAVKGSSSMRKLGDTKTVAGDYYKWANTFANTTPYSNDEVIKGTVRLASFGYDPKKLMTVLGDMTAARGTSLMQGIEAFIDSGVGEMERFKEYGVTKEKIKSYAKSKGIDSSKFINKSNQITDPKLFMDMLLQLIQSETHGGMKDREKSLQGRFSTTVGLLKFNIGKMVGIMEDGEIRQGSLIEKVKERFEKFNNYLQSDEGKSTIEKWAKAFDRAIPNVISLVDKLIDKFSNMDFIKKLQSQIDNFDPNNVNLGLENLEKRFDSFYKKAQRALGAYIGFQIGLAGGLKGAAIGALAGFLSPEIIKGIEYYQELTSKKEKEKEKAIQDIAKRDKELGIKPEDFETTVPYAPALQLQKERNISINMNNVTFNNGVDIETFATQAAEIINNG